MPRMASSVSVGANATSSNQLAGLLEEFSRRPTRIRLGATGAATGMNITFILNDLAVMNDQFLSLINRFPQIPEDLCIDHVIPAGVRAFVTFRNTTGGAIIVFWAADTKAL